MSLFLNFIIIDCFVVVFVCALGMIRFPVYVYT